MTKTWTDILPAAVPALLLVAALVMSFPALAVQPALAAQPTLPPGGEAPLVESETIGVDEIERGQLGYGLSVFAGDRPERFEVEVLGVLRNPTPGTNAILARLSGQGLEKSGVIAGMSGSPVYIDGRLAGAVAFGWNYSQDAIAGITPIAEMRLLGDAPVGVGSPRSAGPIVSLESWLAGDLSEELLVDALENLVPRLGDRTTSGMLWSATGFGETSRRVLESGLGQVASAGFSGQTIAAGGELEPGSPVAAVLIRGDLALAATGTVTERSGREVLAFGHPFLGFGPVEMPMAAAEVITVVPSLANSFKVTNLGPVIGAFREDRAAGMFGNVGDAPALIPVHFKIEGEGTIGPRKFDLEVARLPQITPTLMAVATLGALESAGHREGDQGLDLRATLHLEEYGDIVLEQSFDGSGVGVQAALHLLAFTAMTLQSPLADVELESVDVEIERSSAVRLTQIVGAYAERTTVRPGDTVGVHLELVEHGGQRIRQKVAVEIPDDLDEGRYVLFLADGVSADAARFQLEPAAPVSFPQLLRVLRSLHSRSELVVLGLVQDAGLVLDGEVLPRLPGSVRSLWSSAAAGGAVPLQLAIAHRQSEAMGRPLEGLVRVDLEIEKPFGGR